MIYFYAGPKGSGKTLTMIKDAFIFHKRGYKVFTNMKSVTFGSYINNETILKINKESKLKNCVLLIDEVQTLFNARRSMKKENVDFSFFIQQIRKREIEMLCTSQYTNTTDLILRQHIDILIKPKFFKKYDIVNVEYIDLNSIDEFNLNGNVNRLVFDAKPIYKLYNTNELIV